MYRTDQAYVDEFSRLLERGEGKGTKGDQGDAGFFEKEFPDSYGRRIYEIRENDMSALTERKSSGNAACFLGK